MIKPYKEIIRHAAENAFSNYMGGGVARFPEYILVSWIHGIDEKEVYADFSKEFENVKQEYYNKVSK